MILINIIDKDFYQLVNEIKILNENEIYHRIKNSFDKIPIETQQSCMNFFNEFNYWGKLDLKNNIYEEIDLKAKELHRHIDDFVWLYEKLGDYRSKKTLYAILNNWYCYDFKTTSEVREILYDDYFDLDLVKCTDEEVIVDLGAYTGDTILSYLKNYGEKCYKKIYCYEITPETFEILKLCLKDYKNIDFRLKGIGDKKENFFLLNREENLSANTIANTGEGDVTMTTLDLDIKDPITLIKMDIEGYEQKAINGAQNHIINDHPKLLISVYHQNEDLWKIPRMIDNFSNNYKFYLRYNSSPIYPTEITLIAI